MASQVLKSEAFSERCAKEKKKLLKHLSSQLEGDMQKLLADALNNVHDDREGLRCHKYIVKTRCPELYKSLDTFITEDKDVIPADLMQDYKSVLGFLYCKDDIAVVSNKIESLVSFFDDPTHTNHSNTFKHSLDPSLNGNILDSKETQVETLQSSTKENTSNSFLEKQNGDLYGKLSTECENNFVETNSKNNDEIKSLEKTEGNRSINERDIPQGHNNESILNSCNSNDKCEVDAPEIESNMHNICTENNLQCTGDEHNIDIEISPTALKTPMLNEVVEELTEAVSVLGSDLLYMYQQAVDVDTVLVAQDSRFHVHRAILSARSEYFSAMLGGDWCESTAEEIKLESITAEVLEKVLFYIYGGFVTSNLRELLAAGDMYGITGLKECMEYTLKKDKCHFFHKPCNDCISGIGDTLPVSYLYGLDELFNRCLKWNTRHFDRLWRTRSFAQLPQEVLDKCLDSVVKELGVLNVIQAYMDSIKLIKSLQNLKWGESVVVIATKLINSCILFISKNVMSVINRQKRNIEIAYQGMGEECIDELFRKVMKLQSPQIGIATYCGLSKICAEIEAISEDDYSMYPGGQLRMWQDKYKTLFGYAKQYIITNISTVVTLPEWSMKLKTTEQEALKKEAGFVSVGSESIPRLQKPKLSDKKGMKFTPKLGKLDVNLKSDGHFGARPKTTETKKKKLTYECRSTMKENNGRLLKKGREPGNCSENKKMNKLNGACDRNSNKSAHQMRSDLDSSFKPLNGDSNGTSKAYNNSTTAAINHSNNIVIYNNNGDKLPSPSKYCLMEGMYDFYLYEDGFPNYNMQHICGYVDSSDVVSEIEENNQSSMQEFQVNFLTEIKFTFSIPH